MEVSMYKTIKLYILYIITINYKIYYSIKLFRSST